MATKKKVQNGGARQGAGRKKAKDPKIPLVLHVRESEIEKLGGMDDAKAVMYGSWEEHLGLEHGVDYYSEGSIRKK